MCGMYSNFSDEDIEVKDWEGLVSFMKLWKKELPDSWIKIGKMLDEKNKTFTFESWDEIKLISYFYNESVVFLKCVANYIKGYVSWDFENNDEAGYVEFIGGGCKIHTGVMNWSEWKPEELYSKSKAGFKEDKLKKFMLLGSL